MRCAGLMLMTVLLFPSPSLAQQSERHWLIGHWDGMLAEFTGGGGPARTLQVTSVGRDGLAQGFWYIPSQQAYLAQITVTASHVKVITGAKSVVELTREGESLVGTFVLSDRRSFAVKMVKSAVADHPLVGEWSGRWLRRLTGSSDSGQYYLSIHAVDGNQVMGYYQAFQTVMRRAIEEPFTGTLAQNTLAFGTTRLTIDGDRMEGEARSEQGNFFTIQLVRKK